MTPAFSRFTEHLGALNRLRIRRWVLEPGMRFGAAEAWWKAGEPRRPAHNGVDLLRYETADGGVGEIDGRTRIPALYAGTVVRVAGDFLGQTVAVDHGPLPRGRRLLTLCGHVAPGPHVAAGIRVEAGEAVAVLSCRPGGRVPAHLHLSVALVPADFPAAELTWPALDARAGVLFLDPLPLL